MIVKTFEIRDSMTFIAAIGILIDCNLAEPADLYLMRRAGYSPEIPLVLFTRLDGHGAAHYDPYSWDNRTWQAAHQYVAEHWQELKSGSVVDVEFILGISAQPKVSERLTYLADSGSAVPSTPCINNGTF